MAEVLEELIGRNRGVSLVALRNLPAVPLLAAGAGAAAGKGAAGKADAARGHVYRHGVELVIEGRYAELLAYMQSLEQLPQKLQFGDLQFRVEQHPRCVLTLRVYTLSLDKRWLEI
jgi:MSHA biogenesis protein MshJ